ncbi:endonuclease [beta proteobacterium MWH-UniP1]
MAKKSANRYELLIEKIFQNHYKKQATFEFARSEIETEAANLKVTLPKNLGDLIYSFRYRNPLPKSISATAPKGQEWIIEAAGRARYAFKLVKINRILPNNNLVTVKVPDSTPEIINAYAQGDEQALLAKVRYNRLIDIFLGIATYSLQNHLRTTVKGIGQIEIDEIYVGVDRQGRQYVIPVQAKGGADQLSVVQTRQDIECCKEKFSALICRPVSAQFLDDNRIALFELTIENDLVKVVEERHYKLTAAEEITVQDLEKYANR